MKISEKRIIGLQIRNRNQTGQRQKDFPAFWMYFDQEKIFSRIPELFKLHSYARYFNRLKELIDKYSCFIRLGSSLHIIPNARFILTRFIPILI